MNILYLCDEYPPGRHGGIGTAVQTLAREMVRQGHTVVVAGFYDWGYGGEDEFEDEGVKVYRFRRGLSSGIFNKQDTVPVRALYKALRTSGVFHADIKRSMLRYGVFLNGLIEKYAIRIVEMPDYNDYMRFSKTYVPFPVLPVPVVVKCHGSITFISEGNNYHLPKHIWQMERDILRQATAVCGVSRYAVETTARYLEYTGELTVMYNGIEMPEGVKTQRDPNLVIYTGALTHNKGIYQLMKAWNTVHERIPGAVLTLYGKGPVDKIRKSLSVAAAKTVRFNRHISKKHLYEKLSTAIIAVFPSFAETFGLVAVEAMACKTAVIFTSRTSGPEIIDDGKSGLLVDPEHEQQIADAICYLLQNNDERQSIAINGYNKVKEAFNISKVAAAHIDYYSYVLNKH